MNDYISVLELAEELGRTANYILARAVSAPESLTIWIRPRSWDAHLAKRWRSDDGARTSSLVGGGNKTLHEPIRLAPEVVADQILRDGVLRRLTHDGASPGTSDEVLVLDPARAISMAELLVTEAEGRAVFSRTATSSPADDRRARQVHRLQGLLDAGAFRLNSTEAAGLLFADEGSPAAKRKRLERAVKACPDALPSVFASSAGGGRKRFTDSAEALVLWLDLTRDPRGSQGTGQLESGGRAARGSHPTDEPQSPEQTSSKGPETKPTLQPRTRGSLRDRRSKGRDQ